LVENVSKWQNLAQSDHTSLTHRNIISESLKVKTFGETELQGMSAPLHTINLIFPPQFFMAQYSIFV
jgi:hypothetical protein